MVVGVDYGWMMAWGFSLFNMKTFSNVLVEFGLIVVFYRDALRL